MTCSVPRGEIHRTVSSCVLDERPKALFIRTGNANTNAQMLEINTQLGFVQAWSACLWQISIADARKAVGLVRVAGVTI